MPKISVVMPVWNGEAFLRVAIDSILAQTFADFELIVVDDGSTDTTPQILKSYGDSRLKCHRLEHAGIVVALNHGVAAARADWIARQDADDISRPERFEAQWNAIREQDNAVLSFANASLINEVSAVLRQPHLPRTKALLALRLCFACPIVHSTVMFRRSAFDAAGGYRVDERHAEDFALWGRLIELGEVAPVPDPLVEFRVHEQSVSKKNLQPQLALTRQIAIDHCRRFLSLDDVAAERAFELLRVPPADRSIREWAWFLLHCTPRLKWQSWESAGWLGAQTLRQFCRGFSTPTRVA